jgi:hypothetical protein
MLRQSGLLFKYMYFIDCGNVPDHWPGPGCFDIDSRR